MENKLDEEMQRLRPLKVPWQVDPSTPFLRMFTAECSGDEPTRVTFTGFFRLLMPPAERHAAGFSQVPIVSPPSNTSSAEMALSKMLRPIEVEFSDGLWARISRRYSEREALDPKQFDYSGIPYSSPPIDVKRWLNDFQSLWFKSGHCPNPGAYTVEDSAWRDQLGLLEFEHYVIIGHDAYVEVLARSYVWKDLTAE